MKNFKHSILAMIAVAMISSLAAVQAREIKNTSDMIGKLSTHAQTNSITIEKEQAEEGSDADTTKSDEEAQQAQTEVETSPEAAQKADPETAYVALTSGTLNVRETPSTESTVIDSLDACDEVKILSSSDGWYTIAYDGYKTGYVSRDEITDDKKVAEYDAMHYDNYKDAQIITYGDVANVRTGPGKDSSVKEQLEDGTNVVALWAEGDYIKVAYGEDYEEGYVVNTAVDFTGDWVAKSKVSQRQEEVAEAKAAAERAEAAARENSRRASSEAAASSASTFSGQSSASVSASNKGQALVNTAMQYLGVPYVWGGSSPSGFDCSGLVQYVCRKNGISVSRVAADQANNGTYVSRSNLMPGDLVFFGRGGIHHVGIYVGNGNMIHAPQTGDVVKVSSIETGYRVSSYAGACRVW